MIYVIEGNGTLTKKDETIHFEKGEIYFWDANCRIVKHTGCDFFG